MSGQSYSYTPRNGCTHENTVEDSKEGTIVCLECALVLEDRISFYHYDGGFDKTETKTTTKKEEEDEQMLFELSDRGMFPQNVVYQTVSKYEQYKKFFLGKKQRVDDDDNDENEKKIKNTAIIAFALYTTLIDNNISRTPIEICQIFNVSTSDLWNVEKKLDNYFFSANRASNNVADYIERFGGILNISYSSISRIKTISLQLYGMGGVTPQTLAACLIFLYCKHSPTESIIALKTISEKCYISASNLSRNIKLRDLDTKIRDIM